MATTIIIDTHQFVEELKASGFSEEQAEGLTKALKKSDLDHLVTKADLRTELERIKIDLMKWNASMIAIGVAVLALLKFF